MSLPQQLPNTTDVLVVGAGPSGLACALALTKAGMDVTIVEANAFNANGCRAVAIHANTLETLTTIEAAQPLIDAGLRSTGATFFEGDDARFEIDISQGLAGKTEFPFVLVLAQQDTERIFERKLNEANVSVFRGKAVSSFEATDRGVRVHFQTGEVIETKYLVGADGTGSTIRTQAGIKYTDPHHPGDGQTDQETVMLVLGDVYLKDPLPLMALRDKLTGHFAPSTTTVFIPLHPPDAVPDGEKGVNFFRLVMFLREDELDTPKDPDISHFQKLLDARTQANKVPVVVSKLLTSSKYRVRSAAAEQFFVPCGAEGKILLIGDAAHCHSPAGGQGMNLGICDAVGAARAISSHFSTGDDSILKSHAEHRRSIALEVIGLAQGLTTLNRMSAGWRRLVRNGLLYLVWTLPVMRSLAAWRISGLGYRDPRILTA